MVKAYLSRVGADKGNLRFLGPLFKDYSFEYIPMHEGEHTCTLEDRTFREIDARFSDNKLSHFFTKRKKLKDAKPHFDPEFETFTYGDSTSDGTQFLKLEKGDILVLYAGLDPWNFKRKKGEGSCYIIGYFTVKDVVDFEKSDGDIFEKYPQLLNNAHIKMVNYVSPGDSEELCIHEPQPDLVIVIGDDKKSRLLEEAIPISEPRKKGKQDYAYVSKKMEKELGIWGSIQRKGNGTWIPKYLFSLSKVTGSDKGRLRRYLKVCFGADWVTNADITKTDDEKTITVSSGNNSIEITINKARDKATLKDRGVTHNFLVKKEDGELNIYPEGEHIENLKELLDY